MNNDSILKIKFNRRSVSLCLFWLLYFMPLAIMRIIPNGQLMCIFVRMPIICIIIGNYIRKSDGILRISKYWIYVILMLIWNVFTVALGTPGQTVTYVLSTYTIIEMLIVIAYSINTDGFNGLKPLYVVSVFYIWISFAVMVLFPHGLYMSSQGSSIVRAQWLFGSKNNTPIFMIIFSMVIMAITLHEANTRTRIKNTIMNVSVLLACFESTSASETKVIFMKGSSTGIIVSMAMIALLLYVNVPKWLVKNKLEIFNIKNVMIAIAATNIVVLGGANISFIKNFIENYMHKNMTFSGRVYVWDNCIPYIMKSPIVGHGYVSKVFWTNGATSTYNIFLGILEYYGIPSLILLILAALTLKTSKKMSEQIMLMGILLVAINGLMSQIDAKYLLFFMTILQVTENWYKNNEKLYETEIDNKERKK